MSGKEKDMLEKEAKEKVAKRSSCLEKVRQIQIQMKLKIEIKKIKKIKIKIKMLTATEIQSITCLPGQRTAHTVEAVNLRRQQKRPARVFSTFTNKLFIALFVVLYIPYLIT